MTERGLEEKFVSLPVDWSTFKICLTMTIIIISMVFSYMLSFVFLFKSILNLHITRLLNNLQIEIIEIRVHPRKQWK